MTNDELPESSALRNRRRRRGGPNDPSTPIVDIALLDAAGESMRHAGD